MERLLRFLFPLGLSPTHRHSFSAQTASCGDVRSSIMNSHLSTLYADSLYNAKLFSSTSCTAPQPFVPLCLSFCCTFSMCIPFYKTDICAFTEESEFFCVTEDCEQNNNVKILLSILQIIQSSIRIKKKGAVAIFADTNEFWKKKMYPSTFREMFLGN